MKENMIEAYKNYSPEEYNEMAMELIWKQQQYMPIIIEKYVSKGSVLSCKKGSIKNKFDILQDKGVYDNGNPACTLDDCIVGENVHTFCNCLSYHDSYGHRCIPEPVGNWMQPNSNVKAYNQQSQEYVEILKSSAALACDRGGYITIDETPVPLAAQPAEAACYETHREAFQYENRELLYTYTKNELEHFVNCMDENLITYDNEKKKYVFDMDKYYKNRKRGDPKSDKSNDFVKLYLFFKAEIILREYDLIFEAHYKNWLINGTEVDVSYDYNNLFKKNTALIKSIRTKFMSKDEIDNKKQTLLTNSYFIDLVDTKNIWDIKSRVVVMNFVINNDMLKAIKDRIGDALNDALRGEIKYDEKTKLNNFTLVVEPYGKSSYKYNGVVRLRDYYGNYNYGYVGMEFFYYSMGTKALEHILFWSDKAQRVTNRNPFEGDPQGDKNAINDGGEAWKIDNNIVSE